MASPYYNAVGGFGTKPVDSSAWGNPGGVWWGKDFFDWEPEGRAAYRRFQDASGGNFNYQRFMDNNFMKYRDQWTADGAGQETPTPWTDWLTQNQDRITHEFSALAPTQRGESTRKTGRLRWL